MEIEHGAQIDNVENIQAKIAQIVMYGLCEFDAENAGFQDASAPRTAPTLVTITTGSA